MTEYFKTNVHETRKASELSSNGVLEAMANKSVLAFETEERNITAAAAPVASTKYLRYSLNTTHYQPNSTTATIQENTTVENEQVNVTLEEDFQLENINNAAECGYLKCFFHSKNDPATGYLLTQHIKFKLLERTYALAEHLADKYGVENMLIESPRKVNISEEFASYLNLNKTCASYKKRGAPKIHTRSPVFIQKAKVVPKPYIIIGCMDDKSETGLMEMKEKILPFVTTKPESFLKNLEKGVTLSKQMILNETCLLKDWQAMMDLEGNLYQLDLDRCFQRFSSSKFSYHSCSLNMEGLLEEAKLYFSAANSTQMKNRTTKAIA